MAERGLGRAIQDLLRAQEQRVARLEKRLDVQTPQRRVTERRERLARLEFRLQQTGMSAIRSARQHFDVLRARFEGTNPDIPLARGYAIVTFEGRAVRDAASVPEGARIEAKVQRGLLKARVEEKELDG